jgi:hypothetical protein
MWNDPIVEEVRKARDAHAAKYNYNLEAIFKALKEEEIKSGHKFVKLPPKRIKTKEAQADEA